MRDKGKFIYKTRYQALTRLTSLNKQPLGVSPVATDTHLKNLQGGGRKFDSYPEQTGEFTARALGRVANWGGGPLPRSGVPCIYPFHKLKQAYYFYFLYNCKLLLYIKIINNIYSV
ncbi:hypothetical protein HanIR_Chr06g0292541 [Helianthus annuus]|nr:hypothetical protein HanIR_Chr06g0292541 [Helianthus annuus]